jgi:RNA polymerase sigma-70 factor (ECF subfamily)
LQCAGARPADRAGLPFPRKAALTLVPLTLVTPANSGRFDSVLSQDNSRPAALAPGAELDRWFRDEILPLEPMLVRFLRRNWRDGSEIADLLQEAYARVCESARRAKPVQAKPFLFLVVRNLMIDRMRQKNVVSIETMGDFEWLGISDDRPSPEQHAAARQELRFLQAALDTLPPRCRQVVVLRKVSGFSQREVARQMSITEETVEHQLAKGLRALHDAVSRIKTAKGGRAACRRAPLPAGRDGACLHSA